MTADRFDAEAHMDVLAPTMGLAISTEQRPGVALYLSLSADMASQVLAFSLPQESEPAAVFRPTRRCAR